ncbi:TPA: hypothetical protein L6B75_28335 [Pseudomonas aeruginosa]|nr:hypothetical protein [Pseudomonas aeruginosa]
MLIIINLFQKEQFAGQGGFPQAFKTFDFTTEMNNTSFEFGDLAVLFGILFLLNGGVMFNIRDQLGINFTTLPNKARILACF